MVGLKVPDRTLVTLAAIPESSPDSSVGVRIDGCSIKILISMHNLLLWLLYDFRSKGGVSALYVGVSISPALA